MLESVQVVIITVQVVDRADIRGIARREGRGRRREVPTAVAPCAQAKHLLSTDARDVLVQLTCCN